MLPVRVESRCTAVRVLLLLSCCLPVTVVGTACSSPSALSTNDIADMERHSVRIVNDSEQPVVLAHPGYRPAVLSDANGQTINYATTCQTLCGEPERACGWPSPTFIYVPLGDEIEFTWSAVQYVASDRACTEAFLLANGEYTMEFEFAYVDEPPDAVTELIGTSEIQGPIDFTPRSVDLSLFGTVSHAETTFSLEKESALLIEMRMY